MRKLTLTALLMSAIAVAAADGHVAHLKQMLKQSSKHGVVAAQPAVVSPTATARVFNMVARSFQFDITPSPFVVDAGDIVTLNVSVPANDSSPSGHGILMESFIETPVNVAKGQTRQIQFTATTAGTYAFVCTQSNCGIGHSSMFGQLVVNAATAPVAPTVSSITPSSGSIKGNTLITITGTNFASNSTVRIGGVLATSVVFLSSTTMTARTPRHGAGLKEVEVVNGDASGRKTDGFRYLSDTPKKWSAGS